jgi:hypothetical protein
VTIKRVLLYCLGGLVVLYVAAAASSLPGMLGRTNPSAASWLSPMDFNFSEMYTSGEVLQFKIGMTSGELRDTLLHNYAAHGRIIFNCTVTTAASVMAVESVSAMDFYNAGPHLCAQLDDEHLSARFDLANKVVVGIKLSYVRNESI